MVVVEWMLGVGVPATLVEVRRDGPVDIAWAVHWDPVEHEGDEGRVGRRIVAVDARGVVVVVIGAAHVVVTVALVEAGTLIDVGVTLLRIRRAVDENTVGGNANGTHDGGWQSNHQWSLCDLGRERQLDVDDLLARLVGGRLARPVVPRAAVGLDAPV